MGGLRQWRGGVSPPPHQTQPHQRKHSRLGGAGLGLGGTENAKAFPLTVHRASGRLGHLVPPPPSKKGAGWGVREGLGSSVAGRGRVLIHCLVSRWQSVINSKNPATTIPFKSVSVFISK